MSLIPTYDGASYLGYQNPSPTALPFGLANGGRLAIQAVYVLSSAQLLALGSTAVQIVPAPGVGFALIPESMTLQYKFNTTAYTIANPDNAFQIEYTGKTTNLLKINATGLVDQTVNTISTAMITDAGQDIAQTNEANLGLEIKLTGTAPALTLGAGTLALTLRYDVLVLQ
jgi:hypothetical protein